MRQGCLLSPFLFLLVVESLSRLLYSARLEGFIKGIMVEDHVKLMHLLFVDDVLLFGEGMVREWRNFNHIL
jgi:hypothetical protein